jgi:glyoxylase-like metal-dependent hydrolase (beta-lactamase superfamily II)
MTMSCLITSCALLLASSGAAQEPQHPYTRTDTLDRGVYLIQTHDQPDSWVNSLLVVGDAQVVLVDHAGDWRTLTVSDSVVAVVLAALQRLGVSAPDFLVNTHWHGDHTAGNLPWGVTATVVAHQNARASLATRQTPPWYADGIGPMSPGGLPHVTFDDSLTVHLGGRSVRLLHFGTAHTDGDVVVLVDEMDVVHLGDLYHGAADPSFGEDMPGLAGTLARVIERLSPRAKIVTGHGGVTSLEELRTYHRMLSETIERVRAQLARGASVDDVKQAGLSPAWRDAVRDQEVVDAWLEAIATSLLPVDRSP